MYQSWSPKIITTALPDGAANKAYRSTTLQTTGLKAPLKWSVTPALPAGLTLNASTGAISGTPKAALPKTSFTFSVTNSDAPAVTVTADVSLKIKP
jgi:hypothetical protein